MSKIFELIGTITETTSKIKDELSRMEKEKEDIIIERDAADEKIKEMEEDAMEASPTHEFGLLGKQIDEAFAEVVKSPFTNQVKFLQHLQSFTLNGYK